jgi:hypothetical protein
MKTARTASRGLLLTILTVASGISAPPSRPSQANKQVQVTSIPNPQPPPNPSAESEKQIQDLTHRTQKLELEMIQKADKSSGDVKSSAIATAIIAAVAALVVALSGIAGQYFMARREDRRALIAASRAVELARQEALFQHTGTILEFRLKQMELFYAPVFALLGQSKGLYDKLLYQLVQDDPTRYRFGTDKGPGAYRLEVLDKKGDWQGFRLLDQLPAIRSHPKSLALVDALVKIGSQMIQIISKHAGLASEDLISLLGQYMAHYAILSTIYHLSETDPYPPGWHKVGYYPYDLNAKVEEGYHQLSRFIDEYVRGSEEMLKSLPGAKA